jgi:hypothetical protein
MVLSSGTNTLASNIISNGAAGQFRSMEFRSAGQVRMRLSLNNSAESGSNAGSDLDLYNYNDAGSPLLSPVLRITRSTGAAQFFAAVTPSQTAGIVGTNTNNAANAGAVGEVISAVVAAGAPVALTTGVAANVATINLTAGDWDVYGTVGLTLGGTTAMSSFQAGIATTSATMPSFATVGGSSQLITGSSATGFPAGLSAGACRLSLSATTPVYLLASVGFSVSTASAYGVIWARRAR